jgi:plasmid maintenance system antidote protein VapI
MLFDWLEENDISLPSFARLIGCDRSTLYRNMTDETSISIDSAARIELWTGIPARMWASCPELRDGVAIEAA